MPRFHPQVRRDVSAALRYYDSISDSLGDDLWAEFERICHVVDDHPERFHPDTSGWQRANLRRFPYHLLFYQEFSSVRHASRLSLTECTCSQWRALGIGV